MIKVVQSLEPTLRYLLKAQTLSAIRSFDETKMEDYMKRWSFETLDRLGIDLKVIGKATERPSIFLGNHLSYIDIPVLTSQHPVVFMAKKELSYWPVIGSACRKVGTIFVNRGNKKSRGQGLIKIYEKVSKEKKSVAIFPSGTTSLDESTPWRRGAFKLAEEKGILIQPFRIRYTPDSAAFVGKDAFLPHMNRLLKGKVEAILEFKKAMQIQNADKDMEALKKWTTEILH